MKAELDVLLVGAGHAHLGVLRRWACGRRPRGRIALISSAPYAWYSGMLPGLLAGRYALDQCRIALPSLCAAAGIDWLEDDATDLAAATRTLSLASGRVCQASWLSLNVGAQPPTPAREGDAMEVLPVKPFAGFIGRWEEWRARPAPLAILGGGAAGVELALALAPQVPALTLCCAERLLGAHPPALRTRALRHLQTAGVRVLEHCAVERIRGDALEAGGRTVWRGGRLILASGARPLPWLVDSGLAVDARGFVAIGSTLQSVTHPRILAAGDCASLAATPHSGVYAVRQGPVLANNLSHALAGRPLETYRPQHHALALLADGQGGALMSWAGLTAEGVLFGLWKDFLDRRFMRLHSAGS